MADGMTFDADEVLKNLKKIARRAPEAAGAGCYAGALYIVGETKEGSGKDSGDPSKVPVDTGYLRASHYVVPPESQMGKVACKFGNGARYAAYVHEGTKRMQARPWLRLTIEQAGETARKVIAKKTWDALRAGTGIAVTGGDMPKSQSQGRAQGRREAKQDHSE